MRMFDDPFHTTPYLLLDVARMQVNLDRMARKIEALGCVLRPHVKTHKSIDVLREVQKAGAVRGITVSTLAEAEAFFAAGETDILYAVGVTPDKLVRAHKLLEAGCDVKIVADNPATAGAIAAFRRAHGAAIPTLIELDVDGHRSGVAPDDPMLLEIGAVLHEAGALRGVMTHAGESYKQGDVAHIAAIAATERALSVAAAERLRMAGFACPVVSIGSTPTARFAEDLSGITEVRAGVYTFQDLFQTGLGVCAVDDIAIGVVTSVIGHQARKNWIIVDAGWMALSRDRGTASQEVDQGYGLVCDLAGRPIGDLIVVEANQEHGVIASRSGAACPDLPVGARVRILPNHACATAAQHASYVAMDAEGRAATWPRMRGW